MITGIILHIEAAAETFSMCQSSSSFKITILSDLYFGFITLLNAPYDTFRERFFMP